MKKTVSIKRIRIMAGSGIIGLIAVAGLTSFVEANAIHQPYSASYSIDEHLSQTEERKAVDIRVHGLMPGSKATLSVRTLDSELIHSERITIGQSGSTGLAVALPKGSFWIDVDGENVHSGTRIEEAEFDTKEAITLVGEVIYPHISWQYA